MNDIHPHTIIPAQGWSIAIFIPAADGPAALEEEPILAWGIERIEGSTHNKSQERYVGHFPTPILLFEDNVASIANEWLFRDPSGRYHDGHGASFATTEAALAFLTNRAAKPKPRAIAGA